MRERLLTPSKITAWLDCSHYLTLRHEVDNGVRDQPTHMFGEMAQMLLDKGVAHELQVLARYEAAGRKVYSVPPRARGETFAAWAERVGPALHAEHDVLYQLPLVHDGIRGVADFLERVVTEDGRVCYEPVDAKLARGAAKPGHVLQLCFYAEALAARTGQRPEHVHLELGSGGRETIRVDEVMAYWRRMRATLAKVVSDAPSEPTRPEPCEHCGFCEFQPVCQAQWRAEDSLIYVAGARHTDRELLEADGVGTLAGLALLKHPVEGIDPARQVRLRDQADLQERARRAPEDAPPFQILTPADAEDEALDVARVGAREPSLRGFAALPEPDSGDLFLDYEGHPFWRADAGLFFLFGLIERDAGQWTYRAFWAHDRGGEGQAAVALVEHLHTRLDRHPGMHVYHYNHTERSALERLARDHGVVEREVEALVARGLFVDLYPIVTGALQVGVESYGLKHIERLTDYYRRSHDIDRGAGAVIEYEHWMRDRDDARLARIARYNEDDVRATLAVRDWLVAHRPGGVPWRAAVLDTEPDAPDLDARIEALHAFGPGTAEHLMGDLLGYWRRERRVVAMDTLRLAMAGEHEQLESPGAIARLTYAGPQERFHARSGKLLERAAARFDFPAQPIDPDIRPGAKLILAIDERRWTFFKLESIDRDRGTLTVLPDGDSLPGDVRPSCLVHHAVFDERPKPSALADLADRMLAGDATAVGHAILRSEATRFQPGHRPEAGLFVGDYQHVCAWAPHLDHSYAPVQGPPGTGKTFTGAHVIHTLVTQGQRVGITAMSHHAIDNLTKAVATRFAEEGTTLRAVRKARGGPPVSGVTYIDDNKKCATGPYDVLAGTPWLFASKAMREHPVDVLIVDEAGQLGLADTLAASVSATNVILLGDPQQLPQVAQASHPNRSGVSALEHLLGHGVRTFPPDRGVLLDLTWRMHPDVCTFISEVMYEGRLTSEPSCAKQTTAAGTGLRWIRAQHTQRSTESPEEAEIVAAKIHDLLGADWTDQKGVTRPITAHDIIVVTPYNDQRRLITSTLSTKKATAEVEVGTVDKFQGREAAVVLFSMATSSAEDMPRDASFLFSKNRLNVAISRARCLAYLISTEQLLDTRARDVAQMTLISTLCEFVERTPKTSSA